VPFYVAGALKIAYDLLLFRAFRAVKPPEEAVSPNSPSQSRARDNSAPATDQTRLDGGSGVV
jgi:hypothetical protein